MSIVRRSDEGRDPANTRNTDGLLEATFQADMASNRKSVPGGHDRRGVNRRGCWPGMGHAASCDRWKSPIMGNTSKAEGPHTRERSDTEGTPPPPSAMLRAITPHRRKRLERESGESASMNFWAGSSRPNRRTGRGFAVVPAICRKRRAASSNLEPALPPGNRY
jgi:hypothetical protein